MTDVQDTAGGSEELEIAQQPRSRRQLLRLAGAAAVGGAGMAIVGANPAGAANGGNFILGQQNTATNTTALNTSAGTASLAVGPTGEGGNAIQAISDTGIDVKMSGTGRLGMVASVSGNAQPSYNPGLNDLVKSDTGALWSGLGGIFSSDPTWKRINAVRVDNPNGNGTAFAPFRFARHPQRRTERHQAQRRPTATYDVRGHANIPDDAIAIFGNLTVTGPNFAGWLNLWPAGVTEPVVSAINFTSGSDRGQLLLRRSRHRGRQRRQDQRRSPQEWCPDGFHPRHHRHHGLRPVAPDLHCDATGASAPVVARSDPCARSRSGSGHRGGTRWVAGAAPAVRVGDLNRAGGVEADVPAT